VDHCFIIQTFKELNAQFGTQNRRAQPPITFNRVKVTFKDEPGEGSGVARSFYTSISEALLASAKLPNLDSVLGFSNFMKIETPFNTNTEDEPTVSETNTEALEPKKGNETYKDDDTADLNIYVQLKKKQCLDDTKSHDGNLSNRNAKSTTQITGSSRHCVGLG